MQKKGQKPLRDLFVNTENIKYQNIKNIKCLGKFATLSLKGH